MSYTKQQSAHSTHTLTAIDGSKTKVYKCYEQGIISGRYRDMQAVLAENTGFDGNGFDAAVGSVDDKWYVLNAFDTNDKYIDTVAVGGAMNEDHAVQVATSYFTHLDAGYFALVSSANTSDQPATWSIDAITKLLSNPSQDVHYLRVVTAKELHDEAQRITYDSAQWQSDFTLASHQGSIGNLCHDILKVDTQQEMLSPFDVAAALKDIGASPISDVQFDSLMAAKSRLSMLKDRLFKAMANVAVEGIAVTNVTETKPFKRAGTMNNNIAFVFDLSDGQKLSIWFHSPKERPSNVLPNDVMVSWKWMLNKRDVTAALSPPSGDNVQLPTLAGRIMRLAAKNSKRFKAAQVRAANLQKELEEAEKVVKAKRETIIKLDGEIVELQDKINRAIKAPSFHEEEQADFNVVEPNEQGKVEFTELDDNQIEALSKKTLDTSDMKQSERKKAVKNWLAENLQHKAIKAIDGKKIQFDSKISVDHLAFNSRRNVNKAMLVPFIAEVFAKGEYIGRETPNHDRKNKNIIGFHVYRKWVELPNQYKVHLEVHAAELDNGIFEYVGYNHKKIDSKKATPSDQTTLDSARTNETVAFSENYSFDSLQSQESQELFKILQIIDPNGKEVYESDTVPSTTVEDASTSDIATINTQPITTGKTNNAKTVGGNKIASTFALVEADSLIASHSASGAENPNYPQELQPRDRSRAESIAWAQKTSKSLDPESLGGTRRVDSGAPIVSEDLVVESGNGRTIAIKLAYQNGDAKEYRQYLSDNAAMFGFTAEQVAKYKQPVLVRIRKTDVDRVAFTVEANQDDKLSFTASERARSDAKRISNDMMALLSPSDSGDLLAASNREFIKKFLASLGNEEAAQYTDSNGAPTRALETRVKAAIFNKAYNDDRLLEMMADQANPELQNTLKALTQAAPKFVEARAANLSQTQDLAEHLIDSVEQTLDDQVQTAIADATNMIMNAKHNGQDVTEYVRQIGLFEEVEEGVAELAVFLTQNARSAKKMTALFAAMAEHIENHNTARQNLDMFGAPVPLSINDVVRHAISIVQPPETTPDTSVTSERERLQTRINDLEQMINSADYDISTYNPDQLVRLNAQATTLDDTELLNQVARISDKSVELTTAAIMNQMQNLQGA